jgi:hypothetical protein
MWWFDPQKAQVWEKGMGDASVKMEVGPSEDRYWLEYAKTEEQKKTAASKTQ